MTKSRTRRATVVNLTEEETKILEDVASHKEGLYNLEDEVQSVINFPNGSTISIGPVDEEDKLEGLPVKEKVFVGLHPITGEKVFL